MGRAAPGFVMKIFQLFVILTSLLYQVTALEKVEKVDEVEKVPTQVEVESSREAKLFYVSTLTTTTTLSTSSICHILFSTALGVTTCAKKKRSIAFLEELPIKPTKLNAEDVAPEPSFKDMEVSEIDELLPGIEADGRAARFLNYWMTRTVTSTFTTFTSTSSLGSLYCTPWGYTDIGCPNNGK